MTKRTIKANLQERLRDGSILMLFAAAAVVAMALSAGEEAPAPDATATQAVTTLESNVFPTADLTRHPIAGNGAIGR